MAAAPTVPSPQSIDAVWTSAVPGSLNAAVSAIRVPTFTGSGAAASGPTLGGRFATSSLSVALVLVLAANPGPPRYRAATRRAPLSSNVIVAAAAPVASSGTVWTSTP